ncbi:MAG: hypothetical protein GXC70_08660 [Sphingomonadaceae bacterium]|nr:hypothetical protein [Sphingomonadaceae bacterium]
MLKEGTFAAADCAAYSAPMPFTPPVPRPRLALGLVSLGAALLASGGLASGGLAQTASEGREAGKAPAVNAAPRTATTPPAPPAPPSPSPPLVTTRKADLQVTLSEDGQTVYVVGMILEGSFHKFDAVLRSAPRVRVVHLSSAGGYTIEARLMAALVRKRKLDTYVEFYCASACTQIFAAGRERVIGPMGQIGFHQAVMINDRGMAGKVRPRTDRKLTSTTVFGVNGNDTLRLAYELAGIDPAFIDKALSYGHQNMWLPPANELLEARVITRQAEKAELPGPPGGAGPREVVRSKLLESPLWQAAMARIPAVAEDAVSEVWRSANSGLTMTEAAEAGRSRLIIAVTKGLGRAPDALLERSLALYANSARNQKARGYPACMVKLGTVTLSNHPDDLAFQRDEDALATDFLLSDERVAMMDQSEANRLFAKEIIPKLLDAYRGSDTTSGRCRLGYRTFEAIDELPRKTRLKAYRALLSLPGLSAAE